MKLLLIDQDPIFRLGLKIALEELSDLQVASEAQTYTAALQILTEFAIKDPSQVNLVVLELASSNRQQMGLELCRQLKIEYPHLPIFVLSSVQDAGLLLAARAAGVNGYCPKGTGISELVTALQEVAGGGFYWFGETESRIILNSSPATPNSSVSALSRLGNNWRLSGIAHINATLAEVTAQLQVPGLALLDKVILAGHRRELLMARWLLNQVLPSAPESQYVPPAVDLIFNSPEAKLQSLETNHSPPLLRPRALQAAVFANCVNKLQFPLQNLTDVGLEIDIFREEKKRQLLYLILQKVAEALDELRVSQVEIYQIINLKNTILRDLWQAATTDFFGKFSTVQVGNQNMELVNILLQNATSVETEILSKIPLVEQLLIYLIFQIDLEIDNTSYLASSSQAIEQAGILLENLLIQMANGVVQPLLNSLADVEKIKQTYYNRQFISTREIERFRNNLSWKYRLNNYINEPTAIFESRYELFVLAPRGIAKLSIYAPRSQELREISGVPLTITLILEFRDAIAPRFQALLSLFGSGVVFVLTKIIGRGLGLIGRGILQGIGSVSLSDKNFRGKNEDK